MLPRKTPSIIIQFSIS